MRTSIWAHRIRFRNDSNEPTCTLAALNLAQVVTGRQEAVIQDVEVPLEHAAEFAGYLNREISLKPVGICLAMVHDPSASYPLCQMTPGKGYGDFGFWDEVSTEHEDGYCDKKVEAKVRERHGKQSLDSKNQRIGGSKHDTIPQPG